MKPVTVKEQKARRRRFDLLFGGLDSATSQLAAFEDDIEHVVEFPEVAERWLTAADEAERISRRIARALRAAMAGADLLPDGYGSVPAVTNCAECGEPFEPKRADAQFCGSACRQRAYRQRQRST